ncbi:MAG: tetratricopeptide repeat protein [Lachnospiraceae bacterium]|nr:tetratricopeptide repeat protein [Lachnospiraceae bacterium]
MIVQAESEQFQMLSMMIDDTTRGMCIYQAETAKEQRLVADELKNVNSKNTIIIDMADYAQNINGIPTDIQQVKRILDKFPESQVVIVCNLQLCGLWMGDSAYIEKLNYMRDQLMECNKMWVFGATPYFSILLSQKARDLYTYMMYSCSFVSEDDKDSFTYDRNKEYSGDIRLLVSQFEEYKRYITTQMETGVPDLNMVFKTLRVWLQCVEYLDYVAVEWVENLVCSLGKQLMVEKTEGEEIGIFKLLSDVYLQLGDYQQALKLIKDKLKMVKELFQPDSIEVARAYEDMAQGYFQAEILQKAKEYSQNSMQVYKKLGMEYSLETIDLWHCIARLRMAEQQYDEAIEIQKKNIEIIMELSNESNYGLLIAYNNLGGTYIEKGEISEALKCFQKSQELGKKYHNGNAGVEIGGLNNISGIFHRMGDYDKAKKLLIKAKNSSLRSFGEQNKFTARIYYNLASVYIDLKQWGLAEKNFKKTIEIERKIFGEIHVDVADSYMNLGVACAHQSEMNKLFDAYRYMLKALDIRKQLFPEKNGDIADTYSGLAQVCFKVGDFENALIYLNNAKKINIELYGKNSQNVHTIEYNIRLIKEQMNN